MVSGFALAFFGSIVGVCLLYFLRTRSELAELATYRPRVVAGTIADARALEGGVRLEVQATLRASTVDVLRAPLGERCVLWLLTVECSGCFDLKVADALPFAIDDGRELLVVPPDITVFVRAVESLAATLPPEIAVIAEERGHFFPERGAFHLHQRVLCEGQRVYALVGIVAGSPRVLSLHARSQVQSRDPSLPIHLGVAGVAVSALMAIVLILFFV